MSINITPFSFEGFAVRTIQIDGEPWFVASDVCDSLTVATEQTRRLDEDEKGLRTVQTLGGPQDMLVINESGLYSLILTSRKPEAKRFKKWVTREVLPAIRKTGSYSAQPQALPNFSNPAEGAMRPSLLCRTSPIQRKPQGHGRWSMRPVNWQNAPRPRLVRAAKLRP